MHLREVYVLVFLVFLVLGAIIRTLREVEWSPVCGNFSWEARWEDDRDKYGVEAARAPWLFSCSVTLFLLPLYRAQRAVEINVSVRTIHTESSRDQFINRTIHYKRAVEKYEMELTAARPPKLKQLL